MGRYRKIEVRLWNDAEFRILPELAKLIFLFLATHPSMTMLGAMRATVPGLAVELGVDLDRFEEAFREILGKRMVKYNAEASLVWLPTFLQGNRPEAPNVVKAWPRAWELLPECPLKDEIAQHLKGFTKALPDAFRKAFVEAFPKGIGNQEQEQEQQQKQKQEKSRAQAGGSLPESARADDDKPAKAKLALPAWVPVPNWEAFLEMRKGMKAPLTERAVTLAVNQLEKLRAQGEDPAAVLDQSVMSGYKGLFPVKGKNGRAAPVRKDMPDSLRQGGQRAPSII